MVAINGTFSCGFGKLNLMYEADPIKTRARDERNVWNQKEDVDMMHWAIFTARGFHEVNLALSPTKMVEASSNLTFRVIYITWSLLITFSCLCRVSTIIKVCCLRFEETVIHEEYSQLT